VDIPPLLPATHRISLSLSCVQLVVDSCISLPLWTDGRTSNTNTFTSLCSFHFVQFERLSVKHLQELETSGVDFSTIPHLSLECEATSLEEDTAVLTNLLSFLPVGSLDLSFNGFGALFMNKICLAISNNENVRELSLNGNHPGEEDLHGLYTLIDKGRISALDLSSNK
jgi:hypothetical protein